MAITQTIMEQTGTKLITDSVSTAETLIRAHGWRLVKVGRHEARAPQYINQDLLCHWIDSHKTVIWLSGAPHWTNRDHKDVEYGAHLLEDWSLLSAIPRRATHLRERVTRLFPYHNTNFCNTTTTQNNSVWVLKIILALRALSNYIVSTILLLLMYIS